MPQFDFEYLGPYRVESILGRGGMGTVYKGRHTKSGEPFAIKVISAAVADQPRFRRRFATEVETMIRLKHPNIVQLIGYGEEQGMLFYSMEFVDGHSLHEHLRQHGRIPWNEVVQVGIEVAAALKHAHDFGIIHRDLKPANLMVNSQGTIKLTDFGIAKLFGSSDVTAVGSVLGTADNMSPEQAEGKGVTIRSDLYSLGSVLYALLAGRAPFSGKSVPEVLYSVRYSVAPNLADLVPDAPPELVELIQELLEKDPLKRPPTALVVGNRLKAMQAGLGALRDGPIAADKQSPKTATGKELTSLDLSDANDPDLRFTQPGDWTRKNRTETVSSLFPAKTESGQTGASLASLDELTKPSAHPPENAQLTPSPNALETSSARSVTTITGPTHYTDVASNPSHTHASSASGAVSPTGFDWVHGLSVTGLAALLVGSIGLGWWLLRPKSADSLYRDVILATESGDDSQLLAAHDTIEEFIQRFPNDSRAQELTAWLDEADLLRWTRVLRQRAGRHGGLNELSIVEQGFLDCMLMRENDSQAAETSLSAFIYLFGDSKQLAASERRLVGLARFALLKIRSQPTPTIPPATAQLLALIEAAEKSLTKDQLTDFYNNIIRLYGDKPWAKEPLTRIRQPIANK